MEQDLLKYVITTHEEMIELGKLVGDCAYANMVVTLDGDLGAGKTTFTKGFAETLGVKEIINSPTFTIMKVYQGTIYTLYHLDVYRIENSMNDFELEEYFYFGGVSVIEWSCQIEDLIPPSSIRINIDIDPLTSNRIVTIKTSNLDFINKLKENKVCIN